MTAAAMNSPEVLDGREIVERIDMLVTHTSEAGGITIIVIDGRTTSGKTTLASKLEAIYSTLTIHMDDFFLPWSLKTEERLREPGGNIHYERFAEEVLPFVATGESFSYRVYDCGLGGLKGSRTIPSGNIRIIEGSYSMHPFFGGLGDIKVFCTLNKEAQLERIAKRNGAEALERFVNMWIPLEEAYFDTLDTGDCLIMDGSR